MLTVDKKKFKRHFEFIVFRLQKFHVVYDVINFMLPQRSNSLISSSDWLTH